MTATTRQLHYSMIIEWDPGDEIFIVTVPELPGCRTHGDTYEEAVKQGQDAIETWLDGEDEDQVPRPRYFDHDRDAWPELQPASHVAMASD
jgi:predicted RNase H-like HicB family nuclease